MHETVCELFQNGNSADMHRMCKVLHKYLKNVQDGIETFDYTRLMHKLKLANSCIPFCKTTAEIAVAEMRNSDGSVGEHWSWNDCAEAHKKHGYQHSLADWYYVVNMMYSDYYSAGYTSAVYAQLANAFLSDIDAPEQKAKRYYVAMHFEI